MGANVSSSGEKASPTCNPPTASSSKGNIIAKSPPSDLMKIKKRKHSGFATLRRKIIRHYKRLSKSLDHARAIRDLISTWNSSELSTLVQEYEQLAVLKELTIQADLARPPAPSAKQDLSDLYDYKFCADVELVFQRAVFPAHRAILSARCPYFRRLLAAHPGRGARVTIDAAAAAAPGMRAATFSALLRGLYTGDFAAAGGEDADVLARLSDEFGTPNALDGDLQELLEGAGESGDVVLLFSANSQEFRCHRAILAARSLFFRNLLARRARAEGDAATATTTRIVLDENVIPRRYALVLLHSLYVDAVDLSCVLRAATEPDVKPKTPQLAIDEAMEVHQIGRFLDLAILSQGSEDIIIENLNTDNMLSVLRWASQPHGSDWVYRQAMHFLREEFVSIANSPVLYDMEQHLLMEALKSDYLQASELEVLTAVIKWGEQQLMKQIEEREPNLLSHTAHSVSKKGVKKRDLSDRELREILSDIIGYVRLEHVIPTTSDILNNAIRRGLISRPPLHMLGDELGERVNPWLAGQQGGVYKRPRLFTPYMDEVKAALEERLGEGVAPSSQCRVRMSHIPDTLYMLEDKECQQYYADLPSSQRLPLAVDIIAGDIPVPDLDTVQAMTKRESDLHQLTSVQRALACGDRRAVHHEIKLRVVREFGLPDMVADVLSNVGQLHHEEEPKERRSAAQMRVPVQKVAPELIAASTLVMEDSYSLSAEASGCSHDSSYSDVMPDIAMAARSLSQISIGEASPTATLDLGDGNIHVPAFL
ncbi:PREDICTED: BTB/POZ domain-containing protein 7-like [Priapulus caudatus]|uniref:BTB/POZ domain-containing protein 7-like n=1 Tax=Priapulus caudatus TaxID=37621 RepID=A0ABM1EZ65_PRICU|nr:PREDICTED: BTB/POZ domain-containing protein 7-like [Priapulus caudatus]XP_014677492.1 PREDICTED: BTB/POZ domain-containing protein 7-like [Priapulus caudatus]